MTNDPRQALTWAKRLADDKGDVPAVLHFRVPRSEMDKLNGKIFDGPSDELASFMKHHRSGGAMHNYELVEGPMLRNPGSFVRGKADPVFSGHQVAIYSDRAAELFNNSFHQRFGPAS